MWILIQEKTGELFPIFPNEQYKVGRLSADLVLRDDRSISGTHAYLSVKKSYSNYFLVIEDVGSKNGTFVNEDIKNRKPLVKNLPVQLNDGDRIQFGVMGNSWSVKFKNMCTVSSGLTPEELERLELVLAQCDGKHVSMVDKFSTHLTMKEIKVTLKVISALLSEIPVVNFEYWEDFVKVGHKKKKGPMVSVENYMPRITDVLLAQQHVDFGNNQERKRVFGGKTFVFLSQQHYETYAPIVEKAGGCSRGLKSGVQKTFLLNKNVVVVQYVPSSESQSSQGTQTINTIAEYLEANSRRFIPEYEIALAIIHCSTQKYCNPDYKIIPNMLLSTSTLQDSGSMFVENSNAVNIQGESCDLLIIETESSQHSGQDHISDVLPLDEKILFLNKKFSDTELGESLPSKKRRYNVMSSSSESETEFEQVGKKNCVKPQVMKKRQTLNHSSICDKESSEKLPYEEVDVQFLKISQNVRNRHPHISNMSEDEDDLFNFGDNTSFTLVETDKRNFSLGEKFRASHPPSVKNNFTKGMDSFCLNENDNVRMPTQMNIKAPTNKKGYTTSSNPQFFSSKLSTEGWKTVCNKIGSEVLSRNTPYNEQGFDVKVQKYLSCSEPRKMGFRIETNAMIPRSFEDKSSKPYRSCKRFVKQQLLQR